MPDVCRAYDVYEAYEVLFRDDCIACGLCGDVLRRPRGLGGDFDTVTYNGSEQSVEGYDVSIDNDLYKATDFTFSGNAEAKGTNAGTYDMGLTDDQFTNISDNFANVTFKVTDGWLKITPVTDKVTVTITENSRTVTYDGMEHIVSGYESMTADNPLYDAEDSVEENPTVMGAAKGTDVGTYDVGIKADDFKNTNGNFTNVKFVVVDGALEITPAPVTLQAPIQSNITMNVGDCFE